MLSSLVFRTTDAELEDEGFGPNGEGMGGACGEIVPEYCRRGSGRGRSRCSVKPSDCSGS